MTAVLTTGAPREGWQVVESEQLLSRQPRHRSLGFALRSDGSLAVDPIDSLPDWTEQAVSKLTELLTLPENWDGYGARAVNRSVVPAVLNLLDEVFADGAPPSPDLVPTSDGGVQVEWHTDAFDLEVEISPANEPRAYYCDEESGEEWEGALFLKLDDFARAVARLRAQ